MRKSPLVVIVEASISVVVARATEMSWPCRNMRLRNPHTSEHHLKGSSPGVEDESGTEEAVASAPGGAVSENWQITSG